MQNLARNIVIAISAILISSLTHANAGIPMLMLAAPIYIQSFIPIVILETLYLTKSLKVPAIKSAATVTTANLFSTIIGIPLTWFILVSLQMATGGGSYFDFDTTLGKIITVTWQAPWLSPHEGQLGWMIPSAGIILLIPFFFASWWSEYFISKKILKEIPKKEILAKVRNANLITYTLLTLWPIGFLAIK